MFRSSLNPHAWLSVGTKLNYLSIQPYLFNIYHIVGTRLGASDTDISDKYSAFKRLIRESWKCDLVGMRAVRDA